MQVNAAGIRVIDLMCVMLFCVSLNDAHLCHAYDVLSMDITDGSLCCVVEMKYYVVFKGRRPGVYDDWPSALMNMFANNATIKTMQFMNV